jgi:Uma2 family endonuclease
MHASAYETMITVDDYLAGEDGSDVRHEYIGGTVYAMTGASRRHGLISLNVGSFLRPLVRGSDCQVFVNDMKVRLKIAEDDVFYYPDVVLTCDPTDREPYFCARPCLIVEVLSEQTERVDRREKFLAYTRMPSLEMYVMVAQDRRRVEVFRRRAEWRREVFEAGDMALECLDCALPVDVVYEGVDL